MEKKNVSKIIWASILLCTLLFFNVYLFWFIGLFLEPTLDELVLKKIDTRHVIEASLIAYAIVFPATVIIVEKVFKITKNDIKYVIATTLIFSILKFALTVSDVPDKIGYTSSLIVFVSVCYLLLRFHAKALPFGMPPHANHL